MWGLVAWCNFIKPAHLWACSPDIPSARWQPSQPRCRLCRLQGLQKHQANHISVTLTESLRRARNVIWRRWLRVNQGELTFAAAAAAPQAPSDDQTDGVSRRRGLVLCCRGNRALGRWRKWTSILRWEMMTTGVKICGIQSSSSYSDSVIAHTLRAVGLKRLKKKKKREITEHFALTKSALIRKFILETQ